MTKNYAYGGLNDTGAISQETKLSLTDVERLEINRIVRSAEPATFCCKSKGGDTIRGYGGFVSLFAGLTPVFQPLGPANFQLPSDHFVRGNPDPAIIAVKCDHSTVSNSGYSGPDANNCGNSQRSGQDVTVADTALKSQPSAMTQQKLHFQTL